MFRKIAPLLAALVFVPQVAIGQDFPNKPIRILNGFAPGGPAELITRVIADPLQQRLGQPIVVESRPGASGAIASEAIAKSAPDGYTLGLFIGGHAVSAAVKKNLPYDSVESFQPISSLVYYAFVISTKADSEIKSLPDLIARAKASPGKLSYGSAGNATTSHLTGELLKSMAGIDLLHVPYRGDAASMTALMGGEISMSIATTTLATPRVKAGTLRAIAITSSTRWSGLPDTPSAAETIPGFETRTWAGIMGPKGMPQPVIDRLHREIQVVLTQPETKAKLEQIVGGDARGSTPAEMKAMLQSEIARWKKVVTDANIKEE